MAAIQASVMQAIRRSLDPLWPGWEDIVNYGHYTDSENYTDTENYED